MSLWQFRAMLGGWVKANGGGEHESLTRESAAALGATVLARRTVH